MALKHAPSRKNGHDTEHPIKTGRRTTRRDIRATTSRARLRRGFSRWPRACIERRGFGRARRGSFSFGRRGRFVRARNSAPESEGFRCACESRSRARNGAHGRHKRRSQRQSCATSCEANYFRMLPCVQRVRLRYLATLRATSASSKPSNQSSPQIAWKPSECCPSFFPLTVARSKARS